MIRRKKSLPEIRECYAVNPQYFRFLQLAGHHARGRSAQAAGQRGTGRSGRGSRHQYQPNLYFSLIVL